MFKLYCRMYQGIMKLGMYFVPWKMPKTLEGPGAVKRLPALIKRTNRKKALIVTDKTLMNLHLLDGLFEAMEQEKVAFCLYDKVEPNPTDINVDEGFSIFREQNCDCMIAFGGGSSMDCAKGIGARVARPRKSVQQMQGLFRVLRPIPVIFAVPTTSGTGSETTIAAVITGSETHHKAAINDPSLTPRFAVLDPELTVGLPKQVTATTGMDALSHAVEAYTNNTYNTYLEKDLAKKAVKLIYDNLYRVYEDGSDIQARQNMQKASFYAGRAFTRGSVGYVHAVGHTLGGLYGTPHGLAMAILLPHVMRAFGPAAHKRLAELCDVCGILGQESSEEEKAEAFISWMEEMKEKMEIPLYPPTIKAEDITQIVEWANKEANPLYPTPAVWTKGDLRRFIRSMC